MSDEERKAEVHRIVHAAVDDLLENSRGVKISVIPYSSIIMIEPIEDEPPVNPV